MPYQDINEMLDSFDYVVNSYSGIQSKELSAIQANDINCLLETQVRSLEILKNGGLPWLIEPLRELQPLSFKVLEQYASDYFIGFQWWGRFEEKDRLIIYGFIIVKDKVVMIPNSSCLGDDGYKDFYPIDIQNSWLKHCAGWGLVESYTQFMDVATKLFRGIAGNRAFTRDIGVNHPDWVTTIIPGLREKLPNAFEEEDWDDPDNCYPLLRVVLDSREPDVQTKECDQLLIIEESTDRLLYWVKDFDYDNIAVITNPAEALDLYSSQTLLNLDKAEMPRFDFSPWAQQL